METKLQIQMQPPQRLQLQTQSPQRLTLGLAQPAAAGGTRDYAQLIHKPRINGVELTGDQSSEALRILSEGDTAYWTAHPDYLPRQGEIVIYTDHETVTDELGNTIPVPGIKIGDGNAYVADLPFVGDGLRYLMARELRKHAEDTGVHVSPGEKAFWNAKLNYDVNAEELIFTRD